MFEIFQGILQPYLREDRQLAVALSGGLDSTVLLHLAKQLAQSHPFKLIAIHINHNLSSNALKWQKHCQQICHSWNVPLIIESVHLKGAGQGLEDEARTLRYSAIKQHIAHDAVVLTGQHSSDQIETFLLQLKRGAGPKGLSCMALKSDFSQSALLMRPLLQFDRNTLEQYAQCNQLSWIEDESNADTRFDRNFLRHQVLPILTQRWPGFVKSANRSITLIGEQQQLLDELAQQDLVSIQLADNALNIEVLKTYTEIRQRNVLRYWLASLTIPMPSAKVLDNIINEVIFAVPDAAPKVQWAGQQIRRFRQTLYLYDNHIECRGKDCLLELNSTVELNDKIGKVGLYDRPQLNALPIRPPNDDEVISVRFALQGWRCKPQGSAHTRNLKDLYKQLGVPPWQRSRTPLLFYNEKLAAVGQYFICEGFVVADDSQPFYWQA